MELLSIFQQGQCHIALISMDPVRTLDCLRLGSCPLDGGVVIGLVTMEDVLEKIIQNEIVDETDTNQTLKIFPHGGAPTIFYHQSNQKSYRQHYTHRWSSKRKPKDRTPHRDSVVSSQFYTSQYEESDSEDEAPFPASTSPYYQLNSPGEIEFSLNNRDNPSRIEENAGLLAV